MIRQFTKGRFEDSVVKRGRQKDPSRGEIPPTRSLSLSAFSFRDSLMMAWSSVVCLCFCLLLIVLTPWNAHAQPLSKGRMLPAITLDLSADNSAKEQLGVKSGKTCTLTAIPCELLVIEVFSLYCPICHKNAAAIKSIFRHIEQDPGLKKQIKMIGVGAGNNLKEAGTFKEHFKILFPVFPDPAYAIHKQLGEPRTPATIITDNRGKVLHLHHGVIDDPESFIQLLKSMI
jgi:hypothetical protein